MTLPEYVQIDGAIVEAIRSGASKFEQICDACSSIELPAAKRSRPPWHTIEQRLHALAHAGRIKYRRPGGWEVQQ